MDGGGRSAPLRQLGQHGCWCKATRRAIDAALPGCGGGSSGDAGTRANGTCRVLMRFVGRNPPKHLVAEEQGGKKPLSHNFSGPF